MLYKRQVQVIISDIVISQRWPKFIFNTGHW